MRRIWIGLLAALALAFPTPGAQAATGDPLFVFRPEPPLQTLPPPVGYFEGPCGLAVDGTGRFYVSDYYHHAVDLYDSGHSYQTQIANFDLLDGPCGLAVDSTGRIYVNDFHRSVVRYNAAPSFGTGSVVTGAPSAYPTGVAVDRSNDDVYVDQRDRIDVFSSAGTPGEAVGSGELEDGYGVAVSGYGPTAGLVYVADAATGTIKVFDPEASDELVGEIDGSGTPGGGFVSLRDSAIAVDDSTGEIYVVDDVTPAYKEGHEGVVYVFGPDDAYKGRLKYSVQLAQPAGLAVDNSGGLTQGRVYVTSGYSERAAVYAYAPNSEGSAAVPLPVFVPGPGGGGGSSATQQVAAATLAAAAAPKPDPVVTSAPMRPGHHQRPAGANARPGTALVQKGNIRVKVSGHLSPKKLPRKGAAPITVSVGGDISTTDASPPPRLLSLSIELNRNGRIDSTGLPICPYDSIEPASSKRALSACRSALVGEGTFDAEIALPGQEPYPAKGKMLAFNGRKGGKPVLYGHIYSPRPFATSFVIVFQIERLGHGTFGTKLEAKLPRSLGSWGKLTGIELNLDRRYSYKGQRRSYVSAGCPAPKGSRFTVFSLARTTFGFAGGRQLAGTLTGTCTPR